MSAQRLEPGTVIVAGAGGEFPPDWFLGYADRVERRFFRKVVVDVCGNRWVGVGVLAPGSVSVVEAEHQGIGYRAAVPVGGVSPVLELVQAAPDRPTVARAPGEARSTAYEKRARPVLAETRPS